MIVTSFFARLGFAVDAASLIRVKRVLADLEKRIRSIATPTARIGVSNQQALQRIRQVQKELNGLNNRLIRIRTNVASTTTSVNRATTSLHRFSRAAHGGGGLGQLFGRTVPVRGLSEELHNLTGTLRRLWAWWVTFNAAAGIAGSLLETIRETETLRQRLQTVAGSAQAAGEAFNFIVQVARDTPGSINDVTQAYIRLGQLGIPVSRELFAEVGNFGAAFGANVGDMVKAVSDLAIGVARPFELLTGINADLRSDQSKIIFMWRGQRVEIERNTQAIMDWVREVGRTEFAGATDRWMASILGSIEKLGDAWTAFQRTMADAGLTDALAGLFRELGGVLGRNDDLAVRIGQYLARAVRKLTEAVAFLSKHMEEIVMWFQVLSGVAISAGIAQLATSMARGFFAALHPIRLLIGALMLIPLVLDDLNRFATGRSSFLEGMFAKEDRESARGGIARAFDALRASGEAVLRIINAIVDGFVRFIKTLFNTDNAAEAFERLALGLQATAAAIATIIENLALIPAWLIEEFTGTQYERLEQGARERLARRGNEVESVMGGPTLGAEIFRSASPEMRGEIMQSLWTGLGLGRVSPEAAQAVANANSVQIGDITVVLPGQPSQEMTPARAEAAIRRGFTNGPLDILRSAIRAVRTQAKQ